MENDSKDILHVEFMDKRETSLISVRMEPRAVQKGLQFLISDDVEVAEFVTDAHSTVAARMSK